MISCEFEAACSFAVVLPFCGSIFSFINIFYLIYCSEYRINMKIFILQVPPQVHILCIVSQKSIHLSPVNLVNFESFNSRKPAKETLQFYDHFSNAAKVSLDYLWSRKKDTRWGCSCETSLLLHETDRVIEMQHCGGARDEAVLAGRVDGAPTGHQHAT